MFVQLTKDYLGKPAGERIDLSPADAQQLIGQGVAQALADDPLTPLIQRSVQAAIETSLERALSPFLQQRGPSAPGKPPLPDARQDEARSGFANFGEFALAVRDACQPGKRPDERLALMRKAPAGLNEATNTDGGFLVPTEFSQKLLERVYSHNNLLGMTDSYTVASNTIAFPRNAETSRANGSRWGGVRAYWREEGEQATASKPTFGRLQLTLKKLFVLAHATDELLADTQGMALEQYLLRVASEEINFVVSDAIINGSGTGQPLGILNAPCLVTVSKETGQAAGTVVSQNIVNMWSRLFGPCRSNAVWLVNQDVEPQLLTLTVGSGSGLAAYLPPGGLSAKPYATLLGRPVLPVEWCPTLGTVGDILLVDLRHYVTATKGMIESALSIHLRFDYDESTFRFIFRVDGAPWWSAPLTPYKGSSTQSCFVALQTRD
jgi:HK97 family phage major capsid protein